MLDTDFTEITKRIARLRLDGDFMDPWRVERRIEICAECELSLLHGTEAWCRICNMRGNRRAIALMARFEEEEYPEGLGCKHTGGSRWQEAGV